MSRRLAGPGADAGENALLANDPARFASPSSSAFFDKIEPGTLTIVFDFAHDLVRKVCNFSGSCAKHRAPKALAIVGGLCLIR
jgi:hypothetical protein